MRQGRRRTVAALVALAVGVGPRVVTAQTTPSPAPSGRLRVTTAQGRLVGRVVSIDAEALKLESVSGDRRVIAIPRASITRLEVSERPSRKGLGTGVGLAAGVAGAIILAGAWNGGESYASCVPPPPGSAPLCDDNRGGSSLPRLGLLALPVGTALLGRAIAPGEKWRATDAAELAIRLGPSAGGGAALSVVVGF